MNPIDPEALPARVEQTVARHDLLAGVRRLGIAVSGGADSIALLHLLLPICRQAEVELLALHFNHGLRGADAAADGDLVAVTAARCGIPCRRGGGHVSPGSGRSLEMAAREARLDFFFACAAEASLDAIATGHQADDVAETLLLRLVRGAGTGGLAGLRPCSLLVRRTQRLRLIRPLLECPREPIQAWLRARRIPWREDASNVDTRIRRNAVRHRLLPRLAAECGTDVKRQLARTAEILRADDEWLESLTASWLERQAPGNPAGADELPRAALMEQPLALQRRILRTWLLRQGAVQAAGYATIAAILERCRTPAPWRAAIPGNRMLDGDAGGLRLGGASAVLRSDSSPQELPVPGHATWRHLTVQAWLAPGIVRGRPALGVWPAACSLSAEAVGGRPLTVRGRRPGDRIAPLGMVGSKRIQDLLVDAKIPQNARDAIPLICCGETPVWIPGYRVARAFAVVDEPRPAIQIAITA
ncbi:MAG: tRNA lysidine(34) synthetase TilS [Lentisphaerae bacterium]|nr:tRNA lysidine(34) synthetase TilS [Lentisphaerota bacterium]